MVVLLIPQRVRKRQDPWDVTGSGIPSDQGGRSPIQVALEHSRE